jgi:capsular exopolysaccharide synthesis family protein
MFRRRRMIIYGTLVAFVVVAALYCITCTRRYEATGTVQVQKESADAMGLENLMSGGESAGDALNANIDLQTQANILQSDTLALRTIQDLHLEGTKDFQKRWSPVGMVLGWFSPSGVSDAAGATLENAPQRRQRALNVFSRNLKVKPVSGTRLIKIIYSNPDPQIAAAVVNELAQSLVDYTFQTRYNATNQASEWLNSQMGDLRKESENLQAKVVNLQKQSGVYSLGTTDAQGREQAYSGVLDKLQQATTALSASEQNRILKGAIAQAAETGDAEMLSGLAGNTMGNSQAVNNSLSLIQNLRQQEAAQQSTLQEMEAKFGPSYPKLAEVRGNIAGLERSIREEVLRVRGRAKSDYNVAVQTEANTRNQYEQAKQQADKMNDKAVEYAIVRQEADESRTLYEDLLKRLKEAGVLEGLKSSNITVVDPGRAPAKPKKPNVPFYMALALGGGFFLGCCGALLVDTLDNKINSVDDLEALTGESVMGALPAVGAKDAPGKRNVILAEPTTSGYAEAMRTIRTALLMWRTETPPQVILVTSAIAGEGKSAVSANLAAVLAQQEKRVLVVDTDLRRGTLRRRFDLPSGKGLSAMLSGLEGEFPISTIEKAPGLSVLPSGPVPPNPSELLDSVAMRNYLQQWRRQYDFIVLDGSPLLPVTDAVVMNALADATLLVVRSGMTEKTQVRRSRALLMRNGKHPVGMILNGLKTSDASYYGYYGYRKNSYYSREEQNDHA